jgi:hypothetical protein
MFSESIRNNLLLNLVSEWTFDTGTTTAGNTATNSDVKDAWGSNNGTIIGAPIIKGEEECIDGKCIAFNGVDDGVNCGDSVTLDITKEITVSAWIYLREYEYISHIFKKYVNVTYGSWYVSTGSDAEGKKLRFTFIEDDGTYMGRNTVDDLPIDQWVYIAWVYDGFARCYINMDREAWGAVDVDIMSNSSANFYIAGDGERNLNALIDSVQVYNSAVSESQLRENYLSGLSNLYAKGLITEKEYLNEIALLP